jgi:hypothetical protein
MGLNVDDKLFGMALRTLALSTLMSLLRTVRFSLLSWCILRLARTEVVISDVDIHIALLPLHRYMNHLARGRSCYICLFVCSTRLSGHSDPGI